MQKLIYWSAPFYTLVIAYGSLTDSKIPVVDIEHIDKVYHAGAYVIMMLLWYVFFYHRFLERQVHFDYNLLTILREWSRTIVIAASVFSIVIGGIIELGQGFISLNRSMDALDMVANATGIIIAAIILRFISFVMSRR